MSIAINGVIPCTSARVLMPAIGGWVVDLEVDSGIMPTGPAVLTIGTSSLTGKIAVFANPAINLSIGVGSSDSGAALLAAATTGLGDGAGAFSTAMPLIPSPRTFTD